MESFLDWFIPVLMGCAILSILSLVITGAIYGGKKLRRLGSIGVVDKSDCTESTKMLIDYLSDSAKSTGRSLLSMEVGCDNVFDLRKSKDIARLICKVHEFGGRLVLRRISNEDIECIEHSNLETEKILTDMDIARAKKIIDKYSR